MTALPNCQTHLTLTPLYLRQRETGEGYDVADEIIGNKGGTKMNGVKYLVGEYDVWQGYGGIWYWQVYKPTKDRLVSGEAANKKEAQEKARQTIKKLISYKDTFNPIKYKFRG